MVRNYVSVAFYRLLVGQHTQSSHFMIPLLAIIISCPIFFHYQKKPYTMSTGHFVIIVYYKSRP